MDLRFPLLENYVNRYASDFVSSYAVRRFLLNSLDLAKIVCSEFRDSLSVLRILQFLELSVVFSCIDLVELNGFVYCVL